MGAGMVVRHARLAVDSRISNIKYWPDELDRPANIFYTPRSLIQVELSEA